MPKKPTKKTAWKCVIVNTPEGLDELVSYLKKKKFFAFDTETTGVYPLKDELVGISFAADKKKAYYVPVAHTSTDKQLDRDYVIEKVKPIFFGIPLWVGYFILLSGLQTVVMVYWVRKE